MVSTPDYFADLGVPANATQKDVDKRWRWVMRTWHPDVDGSAEAGANWARASAAYRVIGTEEGRRRYAAERSGGVPQTRSNALEIANWTPAQSNEEARRIRTGRRVGDQAVEANVRFAVENVTFGEGENAVTRPALCCRGEVLESDVAPPSSHPPASEETHKRFAGVHANLAYRFQQGAQQRIDFANMVAAVRNRWSEGDPSFGEGYNLECNGNRYEIAIVVFEDDGRKKGQRVLLRNGAAMEDLPAAVTGVSFATSSDFDLFFAERAQLEEMVDEFVGRRNWIWDQTPTTRTNLDPGDACIVNGQHYGYEDVGWQGPGGTAGSEVMLCAAGVPLGRLPGRAADPRWRGGSLERLVGYMENREIVAKQFEQLVDARAALTNEVRPMMVDLRDGDEVPYGKGQTLRAVMLGWDSGFSRGEELTLCLDNVALNPHWGRITTPGYRRVGLAEATGLRSAVGQMRSALAPVGGPRYTERKRAENAAIAAAVKAERDRKEVEREMRRANRGRIGRFLGGLGGDAPQGDAPWGAGYGNPGPPPGPPSAPPSGIMAPAPDRPAASAGPWQGGHDDARIDDRHPWGTGRRWGRGGDAPARDAGRRTGREQAGPEDGGLR